MTKRRRDAQSLSLTRGALRIEQKAHNRVFLFSLRASDILRVASLSPIGRSVDGQLVGYQRKAIRSHVRDIHGYLEQTDVLFPNPILLAFSHVHFQTSGYTDADGAAVGHLTVPLLQEESPPTGWIVDGQQRTLALAKAQSDLVVPVSAFESASVEKQRDQFVRINNVRPLPRALITELLPSLSGPLPERHKHRAQPSVLCDCLNDDERSPFYGLIRRASTPSGRRRTCVVTDTSLVDVITNSLTSPSGCFFSYQNLTTGDVDTENVYRLLRSYWEGVRRTFPEAWGRPPRQSRLMHGAGIKAMGRLMNHVLRSVNPSTSNLAEIISEEIQSLRPACAWTEGSWHVLGDLPWNALQNTPKHIRLLSDSLIDIYQTRGRR